MRERMRVFANILQIIQEHASESKRPALGSVSIVSEKQLYHFDSIIWRSEQISSALIVAADFKNFASKTAEKIHS